jgi:hypothetical protein
MAAAPEFDGELEPEPPPDVPPLMQVVCRK